MPRAARTVPRTAKTVRRGAPSVRMPVRETGARPAPPAPAVPGVLTAADIMATGRSIVAVQEPSGAIGWPDGHTDAWNHVECAMALSVCGLREPARRAYRWLRARPPADRAGPEEAAARGGGP